jgi:hypothetical protein
VFLIDASRPTGRGNFNFFKRIIPQLLKQFGPFGFYNTHASVWLVSSKKRTKRVIRLGQYNSFPRFIRAVNRLRFIGGRPNIPHALKKIAKSHFPTARPHAIKTVFLLTGSPMRGRKPQKKFRKSVRKLKKHHFQLYPYVIGRALKAPIYMRVFGKRRLVRITTHHINLLRLPRYLYLQLRK